MNSLAGSILFVLLCCVMTLPRKWAMFSLVVGALYLPQDAYLEVAGFNLFPSRLLGYLAFFRVLAKSEFSFAQLNRADKALLVLYGFTTLILLTRPEESPALRLAKMLDIITVYLAFRAWIRSPEEVRWLLGALAALLVPYVAFLAIENATRTNPFAWLGAVGGSWEREGRLRCLGSFRHPSLLGSLGACFLPLFIALAWDPAVRRRAILGAVLCVAIVGFSNSGGPMSVMAMAVFGWFLWPIRARMQTFRRGLVAFILVMALVMKAPIWYLPSRVSSITGGTGWHRSYLMDVAFREIGEWWLVGMPLSKTSDWFLYTLESTGGADITNQFIAFGLSAGITGIALFIFLIYCAFSLVGRALAWIRQKSQRSVDEPLLWGLGVAMAAHISNWLGITYFDQFYVLWLLQLAALVSLSEFFLQQSMGEQGTNRVVDEARFDSDLRLQTVT